MTPMRNYYPALETKIKRSPVLLVKAICLLCLASPSNAGIRWMKQQERPPGGHVQHQSPAVAESIEEKKKLTLLSIPDVDLLDQHGKRIRFYRDLIKGKVVAINFIYTSCIDVCTALTAQFFKLQNLMGERLGKDFFLISISIDPETDTPNRLRAWAEKFKAKPGWTFVTGKQSEVDQILKPFIGGLPKTKEMHAPSIIIYYGDTEVLEEAYGFSSPEEFLKLMDAVSKIKTIKGPEEYSNRN